MALWSLFTLTCFHSVSHNWRQYSFVTIILFLFFWPVSHLPSLVPSFSKFVLLPIVITIWLLRPFRLIVTGTGCYYEKPAYLLIFIGMYRHRPVRRNLCELCRSCMNKLARMSTACKRAYACMRLCRVWLCVCVACVYLCLSVWVCGFMKLSCAYMP